MHPGISSQHTVSMMPRLNPAAQASRLSFVIAFDLFAVTLKRQQQIKKVYS
jgi:hypothetical protein